MRLKVYLCGLCVACGSKGGYAFIGGLLERGELCVLGANGWKYCGVHRLRRLRAIVGQERKQTTSKEGSTMCGRLASW